MGIRKRIPLICCNLFCVFDNVENAEPFITNLKQIGINTTYTKPKFANEIDIKITNFTLAEYWDLDEALTLMFNAVERNMNLLKKLKQSLNCNYIVDIECHKRGDYPALCLKGKCMEYIRFLEAEISIDMYDER